MCRFLAPLVLMLAPVLAFAQEKQGSNHAFLVACSEDRALTVEILGEETLKQIDPKKFDPERRYRIRTTDGPKLLTRTEVIDHIKKRQAQEPPLEEVAIQLYKDGPGKDTVWEKKLREAVEVIEIPGKKQRLAVKLLSAETDAPLK